MIGANEQEGSLGCTLLWNLISHLFGGTVYPVNTKRNNVLGIQCFSTIGAIPANVDLAIIATLVHSVQAIVKEEVQADVKGANVGFIRQNGALLTAILDPSPSL